MQKNWKQKNWLDVRVEVPLDLHKKIKAFAGKNGKSIRQLFLDCVMDKIKQYEGEKNDG